MTRNNQGRQRARIRYLLQPKRSDAAAPTTETVERWECGVREYEQRFGEPLNEDVKIGVVLALAPPSEPLSREHTHTHTS